MSTLILHLAGPLQSWGTSSRFVIRTTNQEPSFSGVVGLIAAAMGYADAEVPFAALTPFEFGVRVDRPGRLMMDYHTIRGGKDGSFDPADWAISRRWYLADAAFTVGLEGDTKRLQDIAGALDHPKACLFLGRRSCPLSAPILYSDPLRPGDLATELRRYPWVPLGAEDWWRPPERVRLRLPSTREHATAVVMDIPLSFARHSRAYAHRYVRDEWMVPVVQ